MIAGIKENKAATGDPGKLLDGQLRELILVGASALELKKKAIEQGMFTLRRSGLVKVAAGMTTMEEVLRETVL